MRTAPETIFLDASSMIAAVSNNQGNSITTPARATAEKQTQSPNDFAMNPTTILEVT